MSNLCRNAQALLEDGDGLLGVTRQDEPGGAIVDDELTELPTHGGGVRTVEFHEGRVLVYGYLLRVAAPRIELRGDVVREGLVGQLAQESAKLGRLLAP